MGRDFIIREKTGSYTDQNKKQYDVYVNGILEIVSLKWQIVETASISVKGHYSIIEPENIQAAMEAVEKNGTTLPSLPKPTLPDDKPVYTNVTNVKKVAGTCCDRVEFDGTKRIAPALASYINDVMEGDDFAVEALLAYPEHPDMVRHQSKEERLAAVNQQINETSNADFDKKMALLQQYKEISESAEDKPHFDVDALLKYYEQVCEMVELQEVNAAGEAQGKVLRLVDYRQTQK